jgi:hypothetical protein
MDLFDAVADEAFRPAPNGQNAYSPWGHLGPKFILAPEKEQSIRRSLRRMSLISTPILTYAGVFYGAQGLWLFGMLLLVQFFLVRYWTRGLVATKESLEDWPVKQRDRVAVPAGMFAIVFVFLAIRAIYQMVVGAPEERVPPPVTLALSILLAYFLWNVSRRRLQAMSGNLDAASSAVEVAT